MPGCYQLLLLIVSIRINVFHMKAGLDHDLSPYPWQAIIYDLMTSHQ